MRRSDELAMAVAPLGAVLPVAVLGGLPSIYVLVFGLMAAYLSALAAGWPLLVLLRRLGWTRAWCLAATGLLLAMPFALVSSILGTRPAVLVALGGMIGGVLVWALALGPNNSSKPTPLRGAA